MESGPNVGSDTVSQLAGTNQTVCVLFEDFVLTQVNIVWTFIHREIADWISGGCRHLDPNRVMTSFLICLTPSAATTGRQKFPEKLLSDAGFLVT